MSSMYFRVNSISRARGSSAVGKAAYDARERLRDERVRKTFDFRARGGLEHAEILRPHGTAVEGSEWTRDRATLWNAAEFAERRKDARVAREYVVALPHELTPEQRLALAQQFAQGIADRYGGVVDLAVHSPPPGGDPRNYHAHALSTTRELTAGGLGRKTAIERNDTARRALGLPRVADELRILRRYWAELANDKLREARLEARLDHRTLAEQGIDRLPQRSVSRAVIEIERRGGHSYVAEWNRREQELLRQRQLEQAVPPAGGTAAASRPVAAGAAPTPADARDASLTIAERQQSGIERWLVYQQELAQPPSPALRARREHTREQDHDLGAEL